MEAISSEKVEKEQVYSRAVLENPTVEQPKRKGALSYKVVEKV